MITRVPRDLHVARRLSLCQWMGAECCARPGSPRAANETSSGLAFQLAPGNQPPTWPNPAVPQQFHLDIMVEDIATAAPKVLSLGAVMLDGENVYADPAGHPFCLLQRPHWALPIPDDDI
jgi:Glyoxalase-like domain